MKNNKLILNLIEISLILFLLFCIFFSQIFTRTIIAVVLLVFMVISLRYIKSYKESGKYNKRLTLLMSIIGIVYLALIYILGIYIGFYEAAVKLSLKTIINYIIPYIVIIISIEKIRKTILLKEDKKAFVVLVIIGVLLDIALSTGINYLSSFKDYFTLISFTIFSSIGNNMLYNYIILKHRNCKAIVSYRIITTIYKYLIPIIPNIHALFETIIGVTVPFIIFLLLQSLYSKREKHITKMAKTRDVIITGVLVVVTTIVIMLISCQFKYGILVIGSGSMTGTINKSDAIVYRELDEDEEIHVGDVIVFNSEDIKVIHRVIDIKNSGIEMRYFTKGDANQTEDDGYRLREDIVGKVKLRIPYIGILPVMINDVLN